jgi:hypothetical protein
MTKILHSLPNDNYYDHQNGDILHDSDVPADRSIMNSEDPNLAVANEASAAIKFDSNFGDTSFENAKEQNQRDLELPLSDEANHNKLQRGEANHKNDSDFGYSSFENNKEHNQDDLELPIWDQANHKSQADEANHTLLSTAEGSKLRKSRNTVSSKYSRSLLESVSVHDCNATEKTHSESIVIRAVVFLPANRSYIFSKEHTLPAIMLAVERAQNTSLANSDVTFDVIYRDSACDNTRAPVALFKVKKNNST